MAAIRKVIIFTPFESIDIAILVKIIKFKVEISLWSMMKDGSELPQVCCAFNDLPGVYLQGLSVPPTEALIQT